MTLVTEGGIMTFTRTSEITAKMDLLNCDLKGTFEIRGVESCDHEAAPFGHSGFY